MICVYIKHCIIYAGHLSEKVQNGCKDRIKCIERKKLRFINF